MDAVVSPGQTPFGAKYVVTDFAVRGTDVFIFALDGIPMRELFDSLLEELSCVDGNDGTFFVGFDIILKQASPSGQESIETNPVLCRVSGADRGLLRPSGFLLLEDAASQYCSIGSKLQFYALTKGGALETLERKLTEYLPLKATAETDTESLLVEGDEGHGSTGGQAAVVFSCVGRGAQLYGEDEDDIEASLIAKCLRPKLNSADDDRNFYHATGFFGGGEIGPLSTKISGLCMQEDKLQIGAAASAHSFATNIAVFR
jgi:hypothetical protein